MSNLSHPSKIRYALNTRPEVDIDLHELIEANRKLTQSPEPYEQVVGSLCVAGILTKRLARLSDTEIGQLLSDYVWSELTLFSPEMAILEEGIQRLFRPVEEDTRGRCLVGNAKERNAP